LLSIALAGDLRGQMTRFKGEVTIFTSAAIRVLIRHLKPQNLSHNAKIAHALKEIANERGVTPAQLAIAWVAALGSHVIPLPGSS
jgi:pyridoxine 4-dehydrogenase